jgi:hypothetical protein
MMRCAVLYAMLAGAAAFMQPLAARRLSKLSAKRRLKKELSTIDKKAKKKASAKVSATVVRSLDEEIAKRERPAGVSVGDYLESLKAMDEPAAPAKAKAPAKPAAKAAAATTDSAPSAADAAAAAVKAKAAAEAAATKKLAKEREGAKAAEAKEAAEDEGRAAFARAAAAAGEEALYLATSRAESSWPPSTAIDAIDAALDKAASLGITSGNAVDAAKAAKVSATRIVALAEEGEGVQPRRQVAAKAAQDWQVARKVAGLRAEGEKVISQRAETAQKQQAYVKEVEEVKAAAVAQKVAGLKAEGEKVIAKRAAGAQKMEAYVKDQAAAEILGDWADADGMLCRLKADGTVVVPPSRGEGGAWTLAGGAVEITLALAQTTRNGVPAGNRAHTLKGSVSNGKLTGSAETLMFGSVASGGLELTKM